MCDGVAVSVADGGAPFASVPTRAAVPVPSPQLIVAVGVSSQPGSVTTTFAVTALFSGFGLLVVRVVTVGGTLLTVTVVDAVLEKPSPLVSFTLTV